MEKQDNARCSCVDQLKVNDSRNYCPSCLLPRNLAYGAKIVVGSMVTWKAGKKDMVGQVCAINVFKSLGFQYIIQSKNGKKLYRKWANEVTIKEAAK